MRDRCAAEVLPYLSVGVAAEQYIAKRSLMPRALASGAIERCREAELQPRAREDTRARSGSMAHRIAIAG